jgi:hypothetical protein
MNQQGVMEKRNTELLDKLARLEHAQWREWALQILDTEEISDARSDRWLGYIRLKDWDDLPENVKDQDIGGKYWASQKEHCGKGCGVCGSDGNEWRGGRCKMGERLNCRYSFCRDGGGMAVDGKYIPMVISSSIEKSYAKRKKR